MEEARRGGGARGATERSVRGTAEKKWRDSKRRREKT
jgi:hypothetical protein